MFFFETFRQRWVTVTTTGNLFHRNYVPHGRCSSFFEDEDDGGVLLCKDNFTEGHPTWESLIEEIAEMGDIEPDSIESVELYYWER